MNRRDFFHSMSMAGYSLAVFAERPASAQTRFDTIAPSRAQRHASGAEPHMALVELEADLLVAGGGMAGVCAAIAAARQGAKVILVQDRSRLGGNASSEVKMHIVGANSHRGRPGWRESGLLEEFRLDDAVNNPQRCWELWDLLLYDKVVSEPNITLLLESTLYAAETASGRIERVMARCDKSETLYGIRAKLFCDATGDSRLALEAGAEWREGREARSEFGESLAPVEADLYTLGSSILFTSRQFHRPMPFTPPKWARKITKDQLAHRPITSFEYGYWWIEWGGTLDTIHDNERIRFELLAIVLGVWDYIKNSGAFPDSANYALDWIGMMPGRRGSRRIVGDHTLTESDLMQGGPFEDAVAIGGWPLDDHPPGGFDRADLAPNTAPRLKDVYNIPLRALYSRNIANLFMAGRNISATHIAFTSSRVMGTCSAIGQAVGTAAALCCRHGMMPRDIATSAPLIAELQQTLLRDDQTIKGIGNRDAADIAPQARATASSEEGEARAALVLDGVTRDIPGGATHHWAARMTAEGAWIELAWEKPQRIASVQLTFDSGFQRELTLSAADSVTNGTIRAAQPETARDYRIAARKAGAEEWTELAHIKGNHQRLARHRFEPVTAERLRIAIDATNGSDFAHLFEVRCYGPNGKGA